MDKLEQLKELIENEIELYNSISVDDSGRDMYGNCMCSNDCGGDCIDYSKDIEVLKEVLQKMNRLKSEPEPEEFCEWKRKVDPYGQPYYERSCTEEWSVKKENCCGNCGLNIKEV